MNIHSAERSPSTVLGTRGRKTGRAEKYPGDACRATAQGTAADVQSLVGIPAADNRLERRIRPRALDKEPERIQIPVSRTNHSVPPLIVEGSRMGAS